MKQIQQKIFFKTDIWKTILKPRKWKLTRKIKKKARLNTDTTKEELSKKNDMRIVEEHRLSKTLGKIKSLQTKAREKGSEILKKI